MSPRGGHMAEPAKCANQVCTCAVPESKPHGKYCSEYCREMKNVTQMRCLCKHEECK